RKISDDVATFLSSTLEKLPKEVRKALSTLSCFGISCRVSVLEILERQLSTSLVPELGAAVEQGILDRVNGSFYFCHDQLQEAAYNTIMPYERCLVHFRYGIALASMNISQNEDDNLLFIAVKQVNHGGPQAVENAAQAKLMANLNLEAGLRAMKMSDFSSGYSFFDNGISFLPKGHWKESYDLSLQLFDNAGKCAMVIGDYVAFRIISDQVVTFAQTFQEKLSTVYNVICVLAAENEIQKAVEKITLILSELGEELPEYFSDSMTKLSIELTRKTLHDFTDKELVEYKMMTDPSKVMAMKFLARLEILFQMTNPNLQPFVTIRMVELSISHGLSQLSPVGFVHFAQLLARLGNFVEACRYVKVAQELSVKRGLNECAGDAIATGTQIMCFVEPVQTMLQFHVEGQTTAQLNGDLQGAFYNSAAYVGTAVQAGAKLSICRENFVQYRRLVEGKSSSWLAHCIQMEKNVLRLIGEQGAGNSTGANDAKIEEELDMGKSNPHAIMIYSYQKIYLHLIFREYEPMEKYAKIFFSFDLYSWTLLYVHTGHAFHSGLAAWWIFRRTNDLKWKATGEKATVTMKKWAESSRHNFAHKAYLLQAEEAFCNDDYQSAKSLYEKSVSAAKQHRYARQEALACELAGHFFLESANRDAALEYFVQAHEKYHEWGANAKSNILFEFVQQSFGLNDSFPAPSSTVQHEHEANKSQRKRNI
ncbi:hypothetical protein ACHAWF_005522, partial [Thalassiosira exigua]